MALTNHVVVRYRATLVGKTNFQDYLVLGDDVVIARGEVARRYQEVIESMGVGISMHKSIVPTPSEMMGMEFASKLVNKDGNLSPLPIVLLTKEGIVAKLQFFSELVTRLVVPGVCRDHLSLDLLADTVFGRRLSRQLRGL